jgi:anaerobic dimethyl sulfoxide reductase subunit C (anchor subunit)
MQADGASLDFYFVAVRWLQQFLLQFFTWGRFKSSWLSREIILVVCFTGITVLYAGAVGLRLPLPWLLYPLGGIGVIAGIGLVYSMSRVYCQSTVPAWNTWQTPVQFFLTTLSIGTVVTILILAMDASIPQFFMVESIRLMAALLVLLLVLHIASFFSWLNPEKRTSAYEESLELLTGKHRKILFAHLLLTCLAILSGFTLLYLASEGSWSAQKAVLFLTALLVFTAEIFGRDVFYIARVRQGV